MYGICIECSHARGMGHLFRAVNLIHYLEKMRRKYLLMLNDDDAAKKILEKEKITSFILVNLNDLNGNWEAKIIEKYGIKKWINDRLDTNEMTAKHVVEAGAVLYTIDDRGAGARFAEGNFASLVFENTDEIQGKNVYLGPDYLILNPEIDRYRRKRREIKKILVTLGGSDTYGVTDIIVESLGELKKDQLKNLGVTVILGPGTRNKDYSRKKAYEFGFEVLENVESLIKEMSKYDLAFTGGGVTAIEAAAMGLPTIVTANELHEIQVGKYLEKKGCSIFAGYYKEADYSCFTRLLSEENITAMSESGLCEIHTNGTYNIIKKMENK